MTLPSVILNYQEKATMTKVKKAYSIINQEYKKESLTIHKRKRHEAE